jgi:hypothetical protein
MLIDNIAVANVVLVARDARIGPAHQLGQYLLALLDWVPASTSITSKTQSTAAWL